MSVYDVAVFLFVIKKHIASAQQAIQYGFDIM